MAESQIFKTFVLTFAVLFRNIQDMQNNLHLEKQAFFNKFSLLSR